MASLVRKCRCHGVSGSCVAQTCWRQLPRLTQVAGYLKALYDKVDGERDKGDHHGREEYRLTTSDAGAATRHPSRADLRDAGMQMLANKRADREASLSSLNGANSFASSNLSQSNRGSSQTDRVRSHRPGQLTAWQRRF
ncbi:unnamed protein product, partial [Protopolystoma xenopodis]